MSKAERERKARAMLEAWLRGLNEGGHPPASPGDIAAVYRAALARVGR